MFDATLLDSSPARLSVLTSRHWAAALLVAVVGSVAGYFVLPLLMLATPSRHIVGSVLTGVGLLLYELMLFYVLADARRLGLNAATWSVILLALNVLGFLGYLIYAAIKTGDWKRAALPLAYIFEVIIVCGLVLLPLIRVEALPRSWIRTETFAPPPPAGPPAAAPRVRATGQPPTRPSAIAPSAIIPKLIPRASDEPAAPLAFSPGNWVPGSLDLAGNGTGNGVPFSTGIGVPPPPPPKPERSAPKRIFLSYIEPAKLLFHPAPEYPNLAIISHTQGTVRLEAVISKDGSIQGLKVLSGHPLLVRAAVDAVSRWRYQPTKLNGQPVEVVTEVEVKFILGDR